MLFHRHQCCSTAMYRTLTWALLCSLAAATRLDSRTRDACESLIVSLQSCIKPDVQPDETCCPSIARFGDSGCFCGWGSRDIYSLWMLHHATALTNLYTTCMARPIVCEEELGPFMMLQHGDELLSSESDDYYAVEEGGYGMPADIPLSVNVYAGHAQVQDQVVHSFSQWFDESHDDVFDEPAGTAGSNTFYVHWDPNQGSSSGNGVHVQVHFDDQQAVGVNGDWFYYSLIGEGDYDDPMDRTDDLSVLMESIMRVIREVTRHMEVHGVTLAVEVNIEEDESVADRLEVDMWRTVGQALCVIGMIVSGLGAIALIRRSVRCVEGRSSLGEGLDYVAADEDEHAAAELHKPLLKHSI